jgi:hypothetical protein
MNRQDQLLLISFVALIAFPLLYAFRSLDDNTLTSWAYVFHDGGVPGTLLAVLAGIGISFVLTRSAVPRSHGAALLFLVSFAALMPLWGAPESVIDASRYFVQAKYLEQEGVLPFFRNWGGEVVAWTDLPLVPFLYGLLFRLFGEERMLIQLFTSLLFSLSTVLVCRIGEKLWDRETGYAAGLLLLAMPYLLIQAPLMLVDAPAMFFLTLSVHAFLSAVTGGGWMRIAAAAVALFLAALTKYSVWPMLGVLPVAAAVLARQDPQVYKRAFLIAGPAGVALGIVILSKCGLFTEQMALLREYQIPALGKWKESFASTFLFQMHPFVGLLALVGAGAAIRERDGRFLVPAWSLLFIVGLRVERIRYMLPLFPFVSLMAAYGLRVFQDAHVRRFIAYTAAAASIAIVLAAYLPFLNRTSMANLRNAGRYLDTLPDETVEVRITPQAASSANTEAALPLLDLYTRKQLVYRQERLRPSSIATPLQSPLRFTWELDWRSPYLRNPGITPSVVAAISGESGPAAAPSDLLAVFRADTGTFRYRTAVTVYRR